MPLLHIAVYKVPRLHQHGLVLCRATSRQYPDLSQAAMRNNSSEISKGSYRYFYALSDHCRVYLCIKDVYYVSVCVSMWFFHNEFLRMGARKNIILQLLVNAEGESIYGNSRFFSLQMILLKR